LYGLRCWNSASRKCSVAGDSGSDLSERPIFGGGNVEVGYIDGTPEWFDDGRLAFSGDGETLLYADKEHGSLEISLKDGVV
jgi:hypothetical protein